MYALLTFDGSSERDPAIAAWFETKAGELGALAGTWFERMRRAGPDVLELFHDGCPVVLVDGAPFAYVNAYRAHVNVGFFHGAALPDPARLLQGSGRSMRHVKIRPGEPLDADALKALVAAAYADIRVRVRYARGESRE